MFLCLEKEFENRLSAEEKQAVKVSVDAAEELGIDIFLIGGIVRDLILNHELKDIDIAVKGDAIRFAEFLSSKINCKIMQVQENLSTVKIEFPFGVQIDFASTREETYSKSGVLPVAHNFGCVLKKDVQRRDFTINTLALKLTGNNKFELVDYYGGYQDIINKKIRILHDKSFVDDPSRIIRALKFKNRLDFELDNKTYNLMQEYLKNPDSTMPLERVKSELKQYFSIDKKDIYDELIKTNAYKLVTENPIKNIDFQKLEEIISVKLLNVEQMSEFYFLLLLLKADFSCSRLNLSSEENRIINQVNNLLISSYDTDNKEKIYRRYHNMEVMSLALYYIISGDKNVIKYWRDLKDIKVLTTGQDLINLGYTPSKYFSEIFDMILSEKIQGKIKTKEEEIDFVKNSIKKESR